uniref:Uncharacterized protein n=1 Tax=Ditylenchus dipsaci TaxID=166011 RepID=A0A915CSQ5_9BILA
MKQYPMKKPGGFLVACGLLVAASLIVGCALYSLRITKRRLRNTASGRYFEGRDKQSTTLPLEDPRGECRYVVDGSCDADNPSSVDLTSTSGNIGVNAKMPDLVEFNVGGKLFTTTFDTISFEKKSTLYLWYIERKGPIQFFYNSELFAIANKQQLWEACLPKDPDRLALLTQEAYYFRLPMLRDQAIALLHTCTEKSDPYVNEMRKSPPKKKEDDEEVVVIDNPDDLSMLDQSLFSMLKDDMAESAVKKRRIEMDSDKEVVVLPKRKATKDKLHKLR